MNSFHYMPGMALLALTSVSGTASASTATINFDTMPAAVYGDANTMGGCDVDGDDGCHHESGITLGTVSDITDNNAHIHQFAEFLSSDFAAQYHQDSAGIYIRKGDLSAFSLDSLDIEFLQGANDFGSGLVAHHKFQIEAFSEAYNADIVGATQGTGANFVGSQLITQANVGIGNLTLDSYFSNVKAVWIHFDGSTETPQGAENFDIRVDNFVISDVSAVPVPAAAYLFGTGLIGLVSLGRKK